jgi:hypothetical protein
MTLDQGGPQPAAQPAWHHPHTHNHEDFADEDDVGGFEPPAAETDPLNITFRHPVVMPYAAALHRLV